MLSLLQSWMGAVEINGKIYSSINTIPSTFKNGDTLNIKLIFNDRRVDKSNKVNDVSSEVSKSEKQYVVSVKKWMTQKSSPSFDWMAKVNNDIPMPLMTMVGVVLSETDKMFKMELHGDIVSKITDSCMMCGKPITNPVSRYFGMGPVCGCHNYTNPFDSDEELKSAVGDYRKKLNEITWTGWITKSAITSMKPFT